MAKDDYYTILGISIPATADDPLVTQDSLKSAYRRALLQNHPDRKLDHASTHVFTVDQILEAYQTLANHSSRVRYHETLVKERGKTALSKSTERSAVEVIDLEELDYVESSQGGLWKRQCRCGDFYQVTEQQLEEVASEGEVVAFCHGCSLSIKVVFNAVDGL